LVFNFSSAGHARQWSARLQRVPKSFLLARKQADVGILERRLGRRKINTVKRKPLNTRIWVAQTAVGCAVTSHSGSAAVSHSAQYFATKKKNLSVAGTNRHGVRSCSAAKRSEMHRDDLMNPDLLSEIVLLGSATLIFITLVAILVTAFTRAAAL